MWRLQMMHRQGVGIRAISRELGASRNTVRRYLRPKTAPGHQMQVDWGAFKLNGQRVSLFLSTLGWSRFTFGVFVENEQFELATCHREKKKSSTINNTKSQR